ncbi:MAG: hypothetical protein WCS94_10360 [Verrucomicrobiota bacterium]
MTAEDEDDRIFSVSERYWFGLCRKDPLKLLPRGGRNVQFATSVSRTGWAGSLALKGYMHNGGSKPESLHIGLPTSFESPVFWLATSIWVTARSCACILAREIPQVPVEEQMKPNFHGEGVFA